MQQANVTCIRANPLKCLHAHVTCGGPIVTCAGGLFSFPTSAFTLLSHVVVLLLLALCGGGVGIIK